MISKYQGVDGSTPDPKLFNAMIEDCNHPPSSYAGKVPEGDMYFIEEYKNLDGIYLGYCIRCGEFPGDYGSMGVDFWLRQVNDPATFRITNDLDRTLAKERIGLGLLIQWCKREGFSLDQIIKRL